MTGGSTSTAAYIVVALIAAVPATVAAVASVLRAFGARDDRHALDDLSDALKAHVEDDLAMQSWIVGRLDSMGDDGRIVFEPDASAE